MSQDQISGISGLSPADAKAAIVACFDFLVESRGLDTECKYSLYHEEFAERVCNRYKKQAVRVERNVLTFAAGDKEKSGPTVERLYDEDPLSVADAQPIAGLIECASGMLTAWRLLQDRLNKRPWDELRPLLLVLSRCEGAATARMVIGCLIAEVGSHGAEVGRIAAELVEHPVPGRNKSVAKANVQAAHVALEVAVQTCHLSQMADATGKVVLVPAPHATRMSARWGWWPSSDSHASSVPWA